MASQRVVVIGASAGGVEAILEMTAALPADFAAPILIVLHVGAFPSVLPELVMRAGTLPSTHAVDGERMRAGHVYVAPPDVHVLVDNYTIRCHRGPKEHHTRPAIDPLFRSAAVSRTNDVIGVLLTGRMNDGTAGLQAIKACGGLAIVQNPKGAEVPDMPASAIANVAVDHCVPIGEIAPLLTSLVSAKEPTMSKGECDQRSAQEHSVFLGVTHAADVLDTLGHPSRFTCPDCSGTLWEIAETRPRRFRCHTGHAYTLRTLRATQALAADESMATAYRALIEKQMLCEELVNELVLEGDAEGAADMRAMIQNIERQKDIISGVLETRDISPEPSL